MVLVNTDVIIGNYIIELVEKGRRRFSFAELKEFDDVLSLRVAKLEYHFKPLLFHVEDFADTYREFVRQDRDGFFIPKDVDKPLLIRHFRIGCPADLLNEIKNVVNELLAKQKSKEYQEIV